MNKWKFKPRLDNSFKSRLIPDQTIPIGADWCGFTLFDTSYLSK